jgi:hypothetical protein
MTATHECVAQRERATETPAIRGGATIMDDFFSEPESHAG